MTAQVTGSPRPPWETRTESPAPGFSPGPASAPAGTWGVNQQMGARAVCVCVCVDIYVCAHLLNK